MKAPIPANEPERFDALRRYEVLDTASEQEFANLALLASHICGTPIALISLIDENRQWFKSKVGMTEDKTAQDIAFCAHGILQPDVFIVEDVQTDKRFADNPLVTGPSKIRFYAGSPVIAPDGHGFGLHSGAPAAKELGGNLLIFSKGTGQGANFTLELPTKYSKSDL